jgi:chromosome segregation protein
MRIKRIEVIGFKSFCDRTVMNFSQPVTAVVGPNGCGKSNIVDAIRWCMGEQSAKHLRGGAMADVIFNGSDTRGPAGMAEVSLTFEDVGFSHETLQLALHEESELNAGADVIPDPGEEDVENPDAPPPEAPVDIDVHAATREAQELLADAPPAIDFAQYSEVTISRRLFRDGTSQYFLNRTPCRLRDITDFFLGTGVGTKAYSIIEQGRIGQIVSSRPQDRRHIIEEAAGITKFKFKKKAAERKLEQTKQNLLRVTDIVSELEKRLGSLRRQAQKAERYRRYRTEMKDIELWSSSHRWLELLAGDKTHRAALEETAAAHQVVRAEFEARDGRLVAERAELAIEERRLSSLQEQIYDRDNRIQLAESKVAYQRREASELDERARSAEGEIRSLAERRADLAVEAERQSSELAAASAEVGARQGEVATREVETQSAREELTRANRELDEARRLLSQAQADLARAESQREALARRRDDTTRRHGQVVEETAAMNRRSAELDADLKRLTEGLAELRQTRMDLGVRAGELEGRRALLEEAQGSSEAEVETLRTELHRRRSRLVSLREIHDRYEGFQRGTRAVMQSAGRSQTDLGDGVRGLVADQIDAPEQLEVAVEAALGDRLGGVLVESHEIGARAVEYLKETGSGRSAFVPYQAESAGFRFEDRSSWWLAGGEGVLGPMRDLVRFEDGYDELGPALFGDALVVDSLERAIELHRSGVKQPLVTLDGDMVDARGVVSGGSRDAQGSGVLAQKREIRELEEISSGLERDLADATARYVSTKNELGQVTRALDGLRHETHDGDLAVAVGEKDIGAARAELERLRERTARLNAEQLDLEERLRQVDEESARMVELEASALERCDRHEREQLGLAGNVAELQIRVESLGQELTEARVSLAQLGEKRASLEVAALRSQAAERELATRIGTLEASIADGAARSTELRADADRIEGELGGLREERYRLGQEMLIGREGYEKRVGEVAAEEIEVRRLRQSSDELGGKASALETRLARLAGDREHLEEAVEERHRVKLSRVVGDYHLRPQVGPAEEERLAELRGLIERMGADINLTAIEEFEQLNVRFGFLSAQRDDLDNAVGQLERAINKINKTSRKLFLDTFEAINHQFQESFPRLFRGGRASLALTDDTGDVLEAGVEIMAQPPGKKNVTVDQLSGGEKALTAVALLFAIFLIKPSPFCLLDEVDAPLDDANVDRYNESLRLMTDRSQFIVITHNKRTMEIADHLYGVTMQEPGVSKLVSVNLAKIGTEAA